MRPKTFILNTAVQYTATPWHRMDDRQSPFNVGFFVDVQGTGTYTVEHGFANFNDVKLPKITRSTTTATVTLPNHGLQVGDSLVVWGCGAPLDGTFPVASVTDANVVTYTVANSGVAAGADPHCVPIRVFQHSSVASKTTSQDGNYAFPVNCVRCTCTVAGTGKYAFHVNQGGV
jgi:hypothetical protein